jgi:hypothetical protein
MLTVMSEAQREFLDRGVGTTGRIGNRLLNWEDG